jgi:propanediol dehydratase small subunit
MGQKIRITEEQLKKVVSVIKEEEWHEMMKNFEKTTSSEVSMSEEDARLMSIYALKWCTGKEDYPDCKHILAITGKHKLFPH